MIFGVAVVNKFYDYYQTWGGMIDDLTGQGVSSIPKYAAAGTGTAKLRRWAASASPWSSRAGLVV